MKHVHEECKKCFEVEFHVFFNTCVECGLVFVVSLLHVLTLSAFGTGDSCRSLSQDTPSPCVLCLSQVASHSRKLVLGIVLLLCCSALVLVALRVIFSLHFFMPVLIWSILFGGGADRHPGS